MIETKQLPICYRYVLITWPRDYPDDWRIFTTDSRTHKCYIYAEHYRKKTIRGSGDAWGNTTSGSEDPNIVVKAEIEKIVRNKALNAQVKEISREEAVAFLL